MFEENIEPNIGTDPFPGWVGNSTTQIKHNTGIESSLDCVFCHDILSPKAKSSMSTNLDVVLGQFILGTPSLYLVWG